MIDKSATKDNGGYLQSLYENKATERDNYLYRARDCSLLTIPQEFPREGHNHTNNLYKPYQSVGARGVNNLANKLMLTQMPPNTPGFKLDADDATIAELAQDDKARAQVEERFNQIERTALKYMESGAFRPNAVSIFRHLIIGGNSLLIRGFGKDAAKKWRVINLANYIVVRDSFGHQKKVVMKEMVRYSDLDENVRKQLDRGMVEWKDESGEKDLALYTGWILMNGRWKRWQEIENIRIEGTDGDWPADDMPVLALRWQAVDGEDYGRSYCEEYLGDLQTAEALSKAIIEAASAASKVIIFVNPSGTTQIEDVVEAENLGVVAGNPEDVQMLALDKRADLAIAQAELDKIERRLGFAFLLNTTVQRNGERVTAEEIREMIKELEDALGGTYALMSEEFQKPMIGMILRELERTNKIPELSSLKSSDGIDITPKITTGIDAIGRGHDQAKLLQFMEQFILPLGEIAFQRINVDDFLKRGGTSLGLDIKGLLKTPEDIQAENEAAMQKQQQEKMQDAVVDAGKAAVGPTINAMSKQQQDAQ